MGVERAAIYLRISSDRAGEALGVARQEADCRALCEQRGWPVAGVYADNDTSAYSGKPRPAYLALLEDVKAGKVDAIVAWDPDRLHRRPIELEAFIPLVDGVEIAMVMAGYYDLTTANGRMVARMLGATARHESEHKSERVRRKMLELAADGKPSGGGHRPFGFMADRVTPDPAEAPIVRDGVDMIVSGRSLHAVTRAWNVRGARTVAGKFWTPPKVRRVLLSPRVAGLREHKGEVVGPAVWPALVERDRWEQCRAILTNPARQTSGPRTLWLSGFLVCGRCGTKLAASKHNGYSCRGCNGISVKREPVEDLIGGLVCALLADGLPAVIPEGDAAEITARLAEIDARLRQWDADSNAGLVDRARWLAATQALNREADTLRRAYGALSPVSRAVGPIDRNAWAALDLDRKTAVLGELVERIVVYPTPSRARAFTADRIEVRWLR